MTLINWLKDKWLKFKKWIVVFFIGMAVLASGNVYFGADKAVDIKDGEKLKVSKEEIIKEEVKPAGTCIKYADVKETICVATTTKDEVEYSYVTDKIVATTTLDGMTEDVSKRTEQAMVYPTGKKNEYVLITPPTADYKIIGTKSFQIEKATTTKEAYDLQTKPKINLLRFFNVAWADPIQSTTTADCTIYAGAPDTADDSTTRTITQIYGSEHSLHRIPIPAGSGTITGITFNGTVYSYDGNAAITAHTITQSSWTEGATWNKYDGTNAWSSAGGDYTASAIDSLSCCTGNGLKTWILLGTGAENPISTSWGSNVDILLRYADESGTTQRYIAVRSSEYSTASQRSYLRITYTTETPAAPAKKISPIINFE